ncbi:hypothetical protein NIES2101_43575 [Calothrix sp. HK-06]|nr:hypothetical protein NIES2101_43575 [Calothrix sp. HK-06]
MAQDLKAGYVCILHVRGTSIYRFSYTTEDPEKKIPQVKAQHPDLCFDDSSYVYFPDIEHAVIVIRESFGEFKCEIYREGGNFYVFKDNINIQNIVNFLLLASNPEL